MTSLFFSKFVRVLVDLYCDEYDFCLGFCLYILLLIVTLLIVPTFSPPPPPPPPHHHHHHHHHNTWWCGKSSPFLHCGLLYYFCTAVFLLHCCTCTYHWYYSYSAGMLFWTAVLNRANLSSLDYGCHSLSVLFTELCIQRHNFQYGG